MGFVKLNVDASFDHDLLRGTTGAVLRDDKGKVIVGGSWKIEWCADALTVEALALRFRLSLAQKAGCSRLVINSDNTEVIETMKNGGREANMVAHEIARLAKFSEPNSWFEEPVDDIVALLRLVIVGVT
ncbi:uncharacterized protein [Aegilops tauschii subsp. strangulata]|uniref:uncharacterized protein n=1 Tax=Aegilops tauschii subsp. strangulata TaxID=200361 RepID=UPI003CC8443A